MEKEKYHPIFESEKVKAYQKGNKTLLVSEKEFTFQTLTTIRKRPRKMKERYTHLQFTKDVYNETDKSLTNRHYSEKGGHKARHDHQVVENKIKKDPVLKEVQVFPRAR